MNLNLPDRNQNSPSALPPCRAFTLLELLVVLLIIGLMAAISLPNIKYMNRSNSMASATRQLLDDMEYARNRAISGHTTVYVLFMPPLDPNLASQAANLSAYQQTNLITGQQISYALYTRRSTGEQPGWETPKYLTRWHTLPQGIFIPISKFSADVNGIRQFQTMSAPVPTIDGMNVPMPYIAFNDQGQLAPDSTGLAQDEIIPLAQGSIFFPKDNYGNLIWDTADVRESPPNNSITNYNRIHIDWLTGRAKVERLEIQ